MAMLFRANGNTEELDAKTLTLEKMWKLVDGYLERIKCTIGDAKDGYTHALYVNDEARITGLPFNSDASQVAGMTILGDAIFVTKEEELLIK